MATQTYAELQKQISDLQSQAERLKNEEIAGVVSRIKEAIAAYGLTTQDLFGKKSGGTASKGKRKGSANQESTAKYMDGKGGQWVGRGKRPKWLSDALASGAKLDDFLAENVQSGGGGLSSAPADGGKPASGKMGRKAKKTAGAKRAASAKYSDGGSNTWSGMGPTPRWLKEAIAGGKTREDFLVGR